jgi:hypothetical protein
VERVSSVAPQDPAQTPEGKKPLSKETAYVATLFTEGRVRVREVRTREGGVRTLYYLEVPEAPKGVVFALPKRLGARLLGQPLLAQHAPRTNGKGLLGGKQDFLRTVPQDRCWGRPFFFFVRGRLAAVDLEEGRLQVEVRPNPGGKLRAPFTLTLLAPLSLLEALPPVGSAVYLEGEVRPRSGRLVVRRWEPARLWDDPQ